MTDAIVAEGLVKRYKNVTASAGIDLRVPEGSVLAMLGPNGAGKTTAVKILTTLITADQGRASVAGCDVADDPRGVRRRIGVSGQYAAVDEYLTGFENLEMIGRLYHLGAARAPRRPSSCWRSFGSRMLPTARRRRTPAACSDGSTSPVPSGASTRAVPRRADHGPRSTQPHGDVEPVAGTCLGWHHPAAHQYLEEADLLADNIIVIDNGKVIAEGTADDLKSQVGGERLEITVGDDAHVGAAVELLGPLAAGELTVDEGRRSLVVPVSGGAAVLADALRRLDAAGVGVDDVGLRPTLDDVFLTLTGHMAEAKPEPEEAHR